MSSDLVARPDTLWYPALTGGAQGQSGLERVLLLQRELGLRIAAVDEGSTNLGAPGEDGLPVGVVYCQ